MIKVHLEDAEGTQGMGRWFDEHLQNGLTANFSEFTYAGIRVRVRQIENDLTDTTITIRPIWSAPLSDDGENEDDGGTESDTVSKQKEQDQDKADKAVEIVHSAGLHGLSLVYRGYLVPFIHPYPSIQEPGKWSLDIVDVTGQPGTFFFDMSYEELEQQLPLALALLTASHGLPGFGEMAKEYTNAFCRKIMEYPYVTVGGPDESK